jgi:SAM-dependent methyltransferase
MEDPREGTRLAAKVDPHRWVAEELGDRISPNTRVLEVGCGPMHLTRAVKHAGAVTAIGVDLNHERLNAGNGTGTVGLAGARATADRLPFPTGSFDLVYSRFLLEYLADPATAVAEMRRVARPGGTVVLQDLDSQLVNNYPPDEVLESLMDEFLAASKGSLDVFIGRKLFSLATGAGLKEVTVRTNAYHLIAGTADPLTMAAWELKLEIAYASIVRALGDDKAHELRCRLLKYLADPCTLTYSTLFTVCGSAPETAGPGGAGRVATWLNASHTDRNSTSEEANQARRNSRWPAGESQV